jgi:polar amino acid transport system ATP-binding protein
LQQVGMAAKAGAYPDELSGGQKQRVAIARCLCMSPRIMLFDEPTSALDPTMVGEVTAVIRKLAADGMTMVIVTHEMSFARQLATRILYMDERGIYEQGTAAQIFDSPTRPKTHDFVNRVRSFNYHVGGRDFDFVQMVNGIANFCTSHALEHGKAARMQLVAEELVVNLLLPVTEAIDLRLSFSERLKHYELEAGYAGAERNVLATAGNGLALEIVNSATEASFEYDKTARLNSLRLVLK